MAEAPTILDLIGNRTMSPQIAATLWAAVDKGVSFVVVAVPRFAGKTTLTNAMLSLLSPQVPVHRLSGDEEEMARLKEEATSGYLVVGEFSQAAPSHYIWGAPVRRVFDTMTAGYSMATALHAPGVEDTFAVICKENGVSDQDASRIGMMIYIRRFGNSLEDFWRRVAEVHEIDGVVNGRPAGRLLHRWVEGDDRFEEVEASRLLHGSEADIKERAAKLEEMVRANRTSAEDVAGMVAEHLHRD